MISPEAIQEGVQYEPVQQICKRVFGKHISPATLWRWIRKGTCGGKLEAVHVNGTWYATADSFADFINRQTSARLGEKLVMTDRDDDLRAAGLL